MSPSQGAANIMSTSVIDLQALTGLSENCEIKFTVEVLLSVS